MSALTLEMCLTRSFKTATACVGWSDSCVGACVSVRARGAASRSSTHQHLRVVFPGELHDGGDDGCGDGARLSDGDDHIEAARRSADRASGGFAGERMRCGRSSLALG